MSSLENINNAIIRNDFRIETQENQRKDRTTGKKGNADDALYIERAILYVARELAYSHGDKDSR